MAKIKTNFKNLIKKLRKKPGTLFIILFLAFLAFGVIFLVYAQSSFGIEFARQKYYSFLNVLGVCAYFSLIIGVVLQLISSRNEDSTVDDSEIVFG